MDKPDIHGEFMQTDEWANNRGHYLPALRETLQRTLTYRDQVAEFLCGEGVPNKNDVLNGLDIDSVIAAIDKTSTEEFRGKGIGEALAELGLFPMYGMPTRSRNLYTRLGYDSYRDQVEPISIDRDLELALQEFAPGRTLVQDKRIHRSAGWSGELLPLSIHRRSRLRIAQMSDGLADPFRLAQCPVCGSYSRVEENRSGNIACKTCSAEIALDSARNCYIPMGFITDFVDSTDKEDDDRITRASRTSTAEAREINLSNVPDTNMDMSLDRQLCVYRLNRGEWQDNDWSGFNAIRGAFELNVRAGNNQNTQVFVNDLWIDAQQTPRRRVRQNTPLDSRERFFMAARRITDALVLSPCKLAAGLDIFAPITGTSGDLYPTKVGFRSGALSACVMIINAASTQLDVDPEEFEILEPRVFGDLFSRRPVLQICDRLINGSGLCDRLAAVSSSGEPFVVELMRRIAGDPQQEPLSELLKPSHAAQCDQSCYECLCRFGNQPYHGILDWRLGLDVICLLLDDDFNAGFGENFGQPGLRDWTKLADQYAAEIVELQGRAAREKIAGLELIEVAPRKWAAIVHPLWDWNMLLQTRPELAAFQQRHGRVRPATTFDLARRLVSTVENCRRDA
jgi:hypothetical protein